MNSCGSLYQDVKQFLELVLGIFVVIPCYLRRANLRNSHLLLVIAMCCSCGEARPLLDNLLSSRSSTLPPVKTRSLQSIIDEILNNTNLPDVALHHDIYRRSLERWSNPCELPGFIFDEEYLEGVPHADPLETAQRILHATKSARGPAQKLLQDYGVQIFHDPYYVKYIAMSLNWLPAAHSEDVKYMSLTRAIKYFGEKLPFYGIAVTQVTLDQVIHSGPFIEETREIEIILTQDVCQLQLGGLGLGVRPSRTKISDAMNKDYKEIKSRSQRNLRDIFILREYNNFLRVMEDAFETIVERTLQNTSTPYWGDAAATSL